LGWSLCCCWQRLLGALMSMEPWTGCPSILLSAALRKIILEPILSYVGQHIGCSLRFFPRSGSTTWKNIQNLRLVEEGMRGQAG
jgi:hypothetical protein